MRRRDEIARNAPSTAFYATHTDVPICMDGAESTDERPSAASSRGDGRASFYFFVCGAAHDLGFCSAYTTMFRGGPRVRFRSEVFYDQVKNFSGKMTKKRRNRTRNQKSR
jgi:hypothetical protein